MGRWGKLRVYGLYGFPTALLPARTAIERLRRHSLPERLRAKSGLQRAALYCFSVLAYPLLSLAETWRYFRQMRQQRPRPGVAELARIYGLALFRNVPPVEYMTYGFQDSAKRAQNSQYLYWTDTTAALWLNRLRGAQNVDVQNKSRFAELCRIHNLPHVASLAEFRGGSMILGDPQLLRAQQNVWMKPFHLNGGLGAMGWSRHESGYVSDDGAMLDEAAWLHELAKADCIVQKRLVVHPDLADLTNGAVVVARLNTVVRRDGTATLLGAAASLPQGQHRTTSGGIGVLLDAATGRLQRLMPGAPEVHPDTGAPLLGRELPQWQEALAMTLDAHRTAFPKFASLGWDVAWTDEGPVLLEANSGWGTMFQQMFEGPLGLSAFNGVVQEELERKASHHR